MTAKLCSFFCVLSLVLACKKPASAPPEPTGPVTTQEINQWVCDSMKRYAYYSNTLNLLADKNQGTLSYFQSLKSANDRFSFIQMNTGESTAKKTCRSVYGFDYIVFTESNSGKTIGLITLVMDMSPAKRAGLTRGMYFSKVNGIPYTNSNVANLALSMLNQNTVSLEICTLSNGNLVKEKDVNVSQGIIWEETQIIQTLVKNNKKVGYVFLSALLNSNRTFYKSIFEEFKATKVRDIILDLRYNSGGDVAAAATICSMISTSIVANSVFIQYKGNKVQGDRVDTFEKAVSLSGGPTFASLQSCNIGLSRVFILSTEATASSAELLINNLKPYIEVIQIGTKTMGKDEAFFQLSDKRTNKRIDDLLFPIVYKLYNKLGEGDYSNGISPKYVFNEFDVLPLGNFGDATDPMIANCLDRIVGLLPASAIQTQGIQQKPGKIKVYNSAVEQPNAKLNLVN